MLQHVDVTARSCSRDRIELRRAERSAYARVFTQRTQHIYDLVHPIIRPRGGDFITLTANLPPCWKIIRPPCRAAFPPLPGVLTADGDVDMSRME
ncbi:hypothetical protein KCP74_16255 [Salmonella enterica subsp. enterica]|nr:hypothetical protein KCP74_16255 [Salmonella enterica subsp. enterica]